MQFDREKIKKFALVASIFALIGLADSIYLVFHHYTSQPVPCSIVEGCEKVLTSKYATFWGIPIALLGSLAYLLVFFWAFLTFFGRTIFWYFFIFQTILMATYSAWLVYLQWAVIESFCQFCLLSAFVCFSLFFLALITVLICKRNC